MARILIIEDNVDERQALSEILVGAGHQVCSSADGKSALAQLRAQHVQLAVIDMIMPEMDGVQTIMALRRDYPDLRVIAISGGGLIRADHYLKIADGLGVAAMLPKPFAPEELLRLIQKVLGL